MRVYLDYAATTPVVQAAKDAVNFYMDEYYNPSAAYLGAREVRAAIENARADIARCIGADPEEIYFTSGATEGNNIAIQGGMKIVRGRFITAETEHHSVLNLTSLYPDNNYIVKVGYDGGIDMNDLRCALDTNDLVSIMLLNNEIGYIQPVADIVKIVRKHKGVTHTDATQAVGHIPIDCHALGVDMLTASGHKFGAPKGVGFIYIRKGFHVPPLTLGGGQENEFRSGTENVCGIMAMAAALKEATEHIKENNKHISEINRYFVAQLANSNIIYSINNGETNHYNGNLSICFMNIRGEELVEFLSQNDIYVSSGSACNTHSDKPSHVLTAIGLTEEQAESSIRISIGNTTTKEDMDYLLQTLKFYIELRGDEG